MATVNANVQIAGGGTVRFTAGGPIWAANARIAGLGTRTGAAVAVRQALAQINGVGGQTNLLRNPRAEGAVVGVGAAGIAPTYWSISLGTGLSSDVVSTGVDAGTGYAYIDVRVYGTLTSAAAGSIRAEVTNFIGANPSDTFAHSIYAALVGGTIASVTNLGFASYGTNRAGTIVYNFPGGAGAVPPASLTGTLQRYTSIQSLSSLATITNIYPVFWITVPQNASCDFTVRLAAPQVEFGATCTAPSFPPPGQPGQSANVLSPDSASFPLTTKLAAALFPGRGGQSNLVRNPRAEGATLGVNGLLPTYWAPGFWNGCTRTVIGTGTDATTGFPYVDVRINGTLTPTFGGQFRFETLTGINCNPRDPFAFSVYVALVGGTLTNVTSVNLTYYLLDATGVTQVAPPAGTVILPAALTATPQRFIAAPWTLPATPVAIANIMPCINFVMPTTGVAIDFTIRMIAPQLEYGSVTTQPDFPPVGQPGPSDNPLSPSANVFTTPVQINGVGGQTNLIRNPRAENATLGSAGNPMPTYWSQLVPSLTRTVIGWGTDGITGLPYIDIRLNGTPSSGSGRVTFETLVNGIFCNPGDPFAFSVYLALVGGSLTNVQSIGIGTFAIDINGTTLVSPGQGFIVSPSLTATPQRFIAPPATLSSDPRVATAYPSIQIYYNLAPVDFTLRIIAPQFEYGSQTTAPSFPLPGLPAPSTTMLSADAAVFTTPVLIPAGGGTTNWIDNPNSENAVVGTIGSGGVFPTSWNFGTQAGCTLQVVADSVDPLTGLAYVDIRLFGTTNTTSTTLRFTPATAIPASAADWWAQSVYLALSGGSQAGGVTFSLICYYINAAGTNLGNTAPLTVVPTATLQRFVTAKLALANNLVRFVWPTIQATFTSGAAIDFTLRIAAPQLERCPVGGTATPPILPPAGQPGVTTRGLLAMPVIGNWAEIDGVGSVTANGSPMRAAGATIGGVGNVAANAQPMRAAAAQFGGVGNVRASPFEIEGDGAIIGGVGGVLATAQPMRAATALIEGGATNRLPDSIPTPGAGNTCIVSTDVAPPVAGATVFRHDFPSSASTNVAGSLTTAWASPVSTYTLSVWVYVPSAFVSGYLLWQFEGGGLVGATQASVNLTLRDQWQFLTAQSPGPPTVNFNLVCRYNNGVTATPPFYSSLWQATPNVVAAAPTVTLPVAAQINGVGGVRASITSDFAAAAAQIGGTGSVQATATVGNFARLAGVGSVSASTRVLAAASTTIAGHGGPINYIRNANLEGAVAGVVGSGGAYPTNWGTIGVSQGLTVTIIGSGIDTSSGQTLSYVDVQYTGTTTPAASFQVTSLDVLNVPGALGDLWAGSLYIALVGGDLTSIPAVSIQHRFFGGGSPASANLGPSLTTTLRRFSLTATQTGTADQFAWYFTLTPSSPVNVTFRIAGPQLEKNSVATPLILPSPGAPGVTNAPLIALAIGSSEIASAEIDGVGGVGAYAGEIFHPTARINGVGSVAATAIESQTGYIEFLAGEGFVTASAVVRAAAQAGIPGVASVSSPAPLLRARGSAEIDGEGFATPDTVATAAARAALAGVGGVVALETAALPAITGIAGVGALRAAALPLFQALATINGAANVAANAQVAGGAFNQTLPGVGTVQARGNIITLIAAEIDGAGGSRVTAGVAIPEAALLGGVGGVTANPVARLPAIARAGGVGSVTAVAATLRAATATVSGQGGQTNYIRNPRAEGAIPGTPGTLPTFWSLSGILSGLAQQIIGSGVDAATGLPYVDIRYFGTATSSAVIQLYVEPNSYLTLATGDVTVTTGWFALVGGSTTNLLAILFGGSNILPSQLTAALQPFSAVNTASSAGPTPSVVPGFLSGTGPVDYTLRLAGFQLEIKTRTPLILPPPGAPAITTRALLAMPTTVQQAVAQIDGRGGVGADLLTQRPGAAQIAGLGAVRATGVESFQAATQIDGVGGLRDTATEAPAVFATIAGVGAVRATGTAVVHVSARIGGTGNLTASAVVPGKNVAANATLAGVGQIAADTLKTGAAFAHFGGVGSVRASARRLTLAAAEIDGVGNVFAQMLYLGQYPGAAEIDGVGNVFASSLQWLTAHAAIAGAGLLKTDTNTGNSVRARLTGTAAVRAAAFIARPAAAHIAGAGAVHQPHTTLVYQAAATIHGTSHLTAHARQGMATAARIDGTGRLRAATVGHFAIQAAATISGTGSLRSRGAVLKGAQARLAGSGTLAGHTLPRVSISAQIDGAGRVIAAVSAIQTTVRARIAGVGALVAAGAVLASVRARIAGRGAVETGGEPARVDAAILDGAGHLAAAASVLHRTFAAAAAIHGTGAVRGAAKAAQTAGASIAGTGHITASSRRLTLALARMAGVGAASLHTFGLSLLAAVRIDGRGQVAATGRHTIQGHAVTDIAGAGHVRASATVIAQIAARITGRGVGAASATLWALARARIAGVGRVQTFISRRLQAGALVPGEGEIEADTVLILAVQAEALIAGVGDFDPDAFIPRPRVAQYGVHLPPTARGVSLSPLPNPNDPVRLPPTKRSVLV